MHSKINKFIFVKRIKIIPYFHHSCARKRKKMFVKNIFSFLFEEPPIKISRSLGKMLKRIQLILDFRYGNFIIGMNQSLIVHLLLKDYDKSRLNAH
jgi:hypothetical protein